MSSGAAVCKTNHTSQQISTCCGELSQQCKLAPRAETDSFVIFLPKAMRAHLSLPRCSSLCSVSSLGSSTTGLVGVLALDDAGDDKSIELGVVAPLMGDSGLCGIGDNAGKSSEPETARDPSNTARTVRRKTSTQESNTCHAQTIV